MKNSDEEYLTTCTNGIGKFVIPEIRNFFYSLNATERCEISSALEKAIYYFDPHNYIGRAYYLEQAGHICCACELYFFAYIFFCLENLAPEDKLIEKINTLSVECDLSNYWCMLQRLYGFIQRLDYEACIDILEDSETAKTVRLLLLKDYLLGLCMYKLGDNFERLQEAREIIQHVAQRAKAVEEGLWDNCQTMLLSFIVNQDGYVSAARKIRTDLEYYYTEKRFASFAQKGLHVLERKSSALYPVEQAVKQTARSVQYFENCTYPSQYLMSLNNHAANSIALGRYGEAQLCLDKANSVLQRFPYISINSMYLLSNFILCGVLSGSITPADACSKLLPIINDNSYADWMFIFKLNYSIYLALDGELGKAEKSLNELKDINDQIKDDYYSFYTAANLAAVLYLQNKRDVAIQILESSCSQVPALFKSTDQVYIKARTNAWLSVMHSDVSIPDPMEFDKHLLKDINKYPDNTQWQFIGRGFLYSDIQFWSEP